MESKFKLPTETITLPSKGLLYPKDNPLSSGEIEMSYMSAKHEDILTNVNFIKNGTVIDKLLQELIVTPINYNELLSGDKDAIMIAARILGYGKDYPIKFTNENTKSEEDYVVDLTDLKEKLINESIITSGVNEFSFTLPQSKEDITFKILTHGDEKAIDQELKGLAKIYPDKSFDTTTRLKYLITSIGGNREKKDIREFVDNYLTAQDARSLRQYYSQVSPGIDMSITIDKDGYTQEGVTLPIGLNFFWPDSSL
jgi:hypothetical protein